MCLLVRKLLYKGTYIEIQKDFTFTWISVILNLIHIIDKSFHSTSINTVKPV